MKMKKVFKVVVIGLVTLFLLYWGTWAVIGQLNKDWMTFNNAMEENDLITMQTMIDDGYDINKRFRKIVYDADHLSLAVANMVQVKPDTVKILLKNGANPNYLGEKKLPLTIFATALKQPEKVKLLIQYGADTSAMAHDKTITDVALVTKQPEIIMMIPEDKINSGFFMVYNPGLIERVIQYYYEGQTDDRILNHWEKHGYFSKTYIDNIRKTKK